MGKFKEMDIERQERVEAAKELHKYDHDFVSPEIVERFATVFGVKLKAYYQKASPHEPKGLTFADGREGGEGMDAAYMASSICRQLGVDYPEKLGRGSQLHSCAEALTKHFEGLGTAK
jgi:hypothetical protein